MPFEPKALPPAADLWERYSYNPLTGELFSLRRPNWPKSLGQADSGGYLVLNLKFARRHVKLHRVIWKWLHGVDAPESIDHVNRVRADNRSWNLREADITLQNRNHSRCILNEQLVAEIRTLLANGESQQKLARDFGVNHATISAINTGANWSQ